MSSIYLAQQRAEKFDWIVFDHQPLRPDWKALIEKHSTRFMVGTDTFNASVNVKKTVSQIRGGLLQKLNPNAAKLVAAGNAIRVTRLEP